jgi:hypothetical protein
MERNARQGTNLLHIGIVERERECYRAKNGGGGNV